MSVCGFTPASKTNGQFILKNEPIINSQLHASQVIQGFVQYDYRYAHVFKDVPHASQIILFLAFHADKKTNLVDFNPKGLTVAQAIEIGLGISLDTWKKSIVPLEKYGAVARIKGSYSQIVINKHLARKDRLENIFDSYQDNLKAKLPKLPDDIVKLFAYKTDQMPFCKFEPLYAVDLVYSLPKVTDLLFYLCHHAHTMSNVAKFKKTVNQELMDSLGLSRNILAKYLKTLEQNGIITKLDRHSVFIHPHVINKGKDNAHWKVLSKYDLANIDMKLVDNYRLLIPSK